MNGRGSLVRFYLRYASANEFDLNHAFSVPSCLWISIDVYL